ncbi:MAG: cryptochrome/photolyase family protein [Hyphomicrobiaceae bacterium]
MPATAILWFRNDLRLADNAALAAAVAANGPIIPLYILDHDAPGRWRPGGASRWWLHGSLAALAESLAALKSRLILARGPTREILPRIAAEAGAATIYCSRAYEPWATALEIDLKAELEGRGITLKRYRGTLLFEPEALRTRQGAPFQVYTPFARAAFASADVGALLPPPRMLRAPKQWPASEELADWQLVPKQPDWASGLRATWSPGEMAAQARLDAFLENAVARYHEQRNRPDLLATSRLSPHLHHGEISPRLCWQRARAVAAATPACADGVELFLKELLWREFSYHLLVQYPLLPEAPCREPFARFPWKHDPERLACWQHGRTGYPIVDAGMRELWATGWMHNRVRMIVGSFLVKHLLQPWQEGEAWFWDTLVDADLASNATSWQWVAGSGADAAPYFRVFNPVKQAETFDPAGNYVRKWCPELAKMPAPQIHAPWNASRELLAAAGVELGRTYPHPIVDHATARARALAAFESLKAAR